MQYITPAMLEFLAGIRANNHKEWFEAHKTQYLETVAAPLKALGEQLFLPYAERGDFLCKTARIYKDANFPPYQHYRDTMYLYIRREAMWWSQTPTLFFEVMPEGARFGFRIAAPQPKLMAYFRTQLAAAPDAFLAIVRALEAQGIPVTGDEYKRAKPCPDEALLPWFKKKSLVAEVMLPPGETLFGDALLPRVQAVFEQVFPLHEYVQDMLTAFERSQAAADVQEPEPDVPFMKKAPDAEFMW